MKAIGKIFLVGVLLIAVLLGGLFAVNYFTQQSVAGPVTKSPSGQIQVSTVNPTDVVTLSFTAVDKLLLENGINTTYRGGNVNFALKGATSDSYVVAPAIAVAPTSSGASKTGVAVNSQVKWVYANSTNQYTTSGDLVADASKSVEIRSIQFSTPQLKLYDLQNGNYSGSAGTTINYSSMGLSAGGASQSFDLYAQIATAYTQFGVDGIYVGCTGFDDVRYTVGAPDWTKLDSLPTIAQNDDKKKVWNTNIKSITAVDGLKKLGRLTVQLNAGQTSLADINCSVYDSAPFLSVDGITVKSGISDDTTSATTTGAKEAMFTLTN